MSTFKIKFEGLEELEKMADKGASVKPKIAQVVRTHGARLHRQMAREAVFGRYTKFKRKSGKRGYTTGHLRGSIQLAITDGERSAVVYVPVSYAAYVELGTRRMRAQPYARPALEKIEPGFLKACEDIVKEITR